MRKRGHSLLSRTLTLNYSQFILPGKRGQQITLCTAAAVSPPSTDATDMDTEIEKSRERSEDGGGLEQRTANDLDLVAVGLLTDVDDVLLLEDEQRIEPLRRFLSSNLTGRELGERDAPVFGKQLRLEPAGHLLHLLLTGSLLEGLRGLGFDSLLADVRHCADQAPPALCRWRHAAASRRRAGGFIESRRVPLSAEVVVIKIAKVIGLELRIETVGAGIARCGLILGRGHLRWRVGRKAGSSQSAQASRDGRRVQNTRRPRSGGRGSTRGRASRRRHVLLVDQVVGSLVDDGRHRRRLFVELVLGGSLPLLSALLWRVLVTSVRSRSSIEAEPVSLGVAQESENFFGFFWRKQSLNMELSQKLPRENASD